MHERQIKIILKQMEELKSIPRSPSELGGTSKKDPFSSTIKVLSNLSKAVTLPAFKEALRYAWNKVQIEVNRYWHNYKIDL